MLLKEKNPVTEEEFKSLVDRASQSSFLKGNNDRNWKATFDWFLAIENMNKIIEGNFNFEKINKPKNLKKIHRNYSIINLLEIKIYN